MKLAGGIDDTKRENGKRASEQAEKLKRPIGSKQRPKSLTLATAEKPLLPIGRFSFSVPYRSL